MKTGFACHLNGGFGRHSVSNRTLEGRVFGIDAHLYFGKLPAVGRIDIVGAGRGAANKIA